MSLLRWPGPARPPFGAPLSLLLAALVAQSLLAWVGGGGDGTLAWAILGARALLVLVAVASWISIVRSSPFEAWRAMSLGASLVLIALDVPGLQVAGYVGASLALLTLPWPAQVMGWRRAVGLATVLPVAALTVVAEVGAPPAPRGVISFAIGVAMALLRVQLAVAFFRFLMLPVGLRTLPLARRFAVNFTLTRSIPGFLSTLTIFAVVVVGYGLHKAAEARRDLEGALGRAAAAATVLLEDGAPGDALSRTHLALGDEARDAAMVVRGPGGAVAEPPSFAADPAFADDASPRVGGLLIAGDRIYLVARERRESEGSARTAEVWVPVDRAYLDRLSERTLVDVELRVMRSVRLGAIAVSFGTDGGGEGPASVAVRSQIAPPAWATGHGVLVRKFPISRLLLPIGNWAETDEGRRGAVGLTLSGSLDQVIRAVRRNPYILTSNAVPFLVLGALGALIGIVEGLSVRTGRSIVQAVLDDVRTLETGAERIGSGDLDHRISIAGRDELSRLGAVLNEMAANLKRQRDELVDKERLEADLEVARSIQQRLLPQGPPSVAGIDVAGISLPSRVVGGDLFYFLPFEEGRLGLAIGDVSGKSVPAALLMSNVVAILRAEAQIGVAVDESLSRMNRLVAEQVEPNRFVTLFYGVVDRPAGAVRYACAGHNPPLILRADGSIRWLREGNPPLGVVAETDYRAATEPFAAGDVLVLYSDGVTESESAATGELFGEERLVAAVAAVRGRPAAEILEAVFATLRAFTDGRPASDDRTLVVVRAT